MKKFIISAGLFIMLISTTFAAINKPTNLKIDFRGYSGGNLFSQLSWKDNSVNEYGFQLMTRHNSGSAWITAQNIIPNTTITYVLLPAYGTGACKDNYYKIRAYTYNYGTGSTGSGIEYSGYSNQVNVINNSGAICN